MVSVVRLSLSLLLLIKLWKINAQPFLQANRNLTFMFVTSYGQFGLNSSGVIPAADIALENINNSSDILPGYNLVYDEVRDSQCQHVRALDVFFDGIQVDPVEIAVIGCGCSVATAPVAEISHRWNIPQLSYVSGLPPLSDRTAFPGFFQNTPPFEMVTETLNSLMDQFKWKRIALLTQDELPFTRAELTFRLELEPANITVESYLFETLDDPVATNNDLFFEDDDYRVFFLNSYSEPARRTICEASRRGLIYPRYAWITYDWYSQGWWQSQPGDGLSFCSTDELKQFLERTISIKWHPPFDQENITTTDAGLSRLEFDNEYILRATAGGFGVVDAASSVYDILWVLALALNDTMNMAASGDISETECSGLPGSLVNLEDFDHRNKLMGCLIQWNLQNTNFNGVSGLITYDVNRTRINNRVNLRQYIMDERGQLNRQTFARLDRSDNYTFVFESGFNVSIVYPDGVPLDGTILNITHTFETELVVVFDILATFGIAFVIGCFIFNFAFRNRKIVKISSPSLNYFIILGALLMYSSIYFYLIPTLNQDIVLTGCILQTWLFTIGYSLAFGAVLAKMWRIYQIFNNPKPKKKVLTDWHLVAATLLVTAVSLVLLILEAGVPQLRGVVTREKDGERSATRTEDLGIRQEFYVLVCYASLSPSFFWRIFIFAYLAILQLLGIVLSFQTRRVKYTGLRDSKFIAVIIYISSIVVVVLALVTFSLRTYINVGTGIFVTGYFVLTTIFLALIFIPKMVMLYKDPHGNAVTENTITHSVNASARDTALKLNNFPSQIPRSGSDAHVMASTVHIIERSS